MTLRYRITFTSSNMQLGDRKRRQEIVGNEVPYDTLKIGDVLEEEIETHRQWLKRITGLTVEIETAE